MFEYVKYNCHVMCKNDIGNKTPDELLSTYIINRRNNMDYVFQGVECIVVSVSWASGKSSIITKIIRKSDL